MQPVISFERVTKRFGTQLALDGVSLEIPRGVVFALLGENGAGKTTALRIALGLEAADSGETEVLRLDSKHKGQEIRRRVGYLPERPTLYEWMTVDEIGWFTAGFYDAEYLPRYRQLAAEFGLPGNRKIKALSKGMRAKVALSLVMADEPELMILDEPTSGLDTLVRREFLQSMVDVAATGRTVVLSSHQIGEVERVADHVAILHAGRLVVVERLDDLKAQTRQLSLAMHEATPLPEFEGEILTAQRRGRQWQVVVRNLPEDELHRLRESDLVYEAELRPLSLEEIFVAYLQREEPRPPAPSQAEALLS